MRGYEQRMRAKAAALSSGRREAYEAVWNAVWWGIPEGLLPQATIVSLADAAAYQVVADLMDASDSERR